MSELGYPPPPPPYHEQNAWDARPPRLSDYVDEVNRIAAAAAAVTDAEARFRVYMNGKHVGWLNDGELRYRVADDLEAETLGVYESKIGGTTIRQTELTPAQAERVGFAPTAVRVTFAEPYLTGAEAAPAVDPGPRSPYAEHAERVNRIVDVVADAIDLGLLEIKSVEHIIDGGRWTELGILAADDVLERILRR